MKRIAAVALALILMFGLTCRPVSAAGTVLRLPAMLTTIEDEAFMNDASIRRVDIPNRVTHIGAYAFYNCPNLAHVIIPESVTYIGEQAFGPVWETLTIWGKAGSTAEVYANGYGISFRAYEMITEDGLALAGYGDGWAVVDYLGDAGSLIIPTVYDGRPVLALSDGAMYGNGTLQSVLIPEQITDIGAGVLSDCPNLRVIQGRDGSDAQALARDLGVAFADVSVRIVVQPMCAHIVTGETALFTIEADNVARYLWQVCEGDTGIWHSVESGVDDSGTLVVPYDPDNALRTWRCVLIGLTGDEDLTDVVSVTYYPSAPSNVTILNDATRVSVGGTLALGAEIYPSDACQIVSWTSSNIAAATVDADGRVTGVAAGTATITAMAVNGVTASLKVEVMYLDVTTSLPARTTAKSAISSNLSQIDTIRQSASSVVTSLGKSGAITLTEAAERRAIVNRAFAMLEFPWMTLSTQEYWKQEYAYKRYVPGTVYYGLPYIQTGANDNLRNREYNVAKALSENRYYDSGSGYYILNRNNLLSSMYVGNDCSSFVSMATFGLSHPASFYNTTNLAGSRYHRSISFSELRPGDMMVRAYNHTVMFLYWVDETKTRCMIIEQGGGDNSNTVSCSIKSISAYSNFTPRRVATFR